MTAPFGPRQWIDTGEGLAKLAAEFAEAAVAAPGVVMGVAEKSAARLEKDWKRRWTRPHGTHIPNLPTAITHEVHLTEVGVVAEIGVDMDLPKKTQKSIAHLIEYGSVNNAPMPGGAPALALETPKFEAALIASLRVLGL